MEEAFNKWSSHYILKMSTENVPVLGAMPGTEQVQMNREPDILECEVMWALGIITTNKASGGDGIPVELFQVLKVDAVKVLHSICQQIWRSHQWP